MIALKILGAGIEQVLIRKWAPFKAAFEFRPQQGDGDGGGAPLEEDRHLVVEAGTGVEQVAHLSRSAILCARTAKKRSFHTINLQEQLLHKGIPILKKFAS
jgi:ATP-dependent DNA helicase DinG